MSEENPTKRIAGHLFVETFAGAICDCGRKKIHVMGATADDIGFADIAHTGLLSKYEYDEICAERDRMWQAGFGMAA